MLRRNLLIALMVVFAAGCGKQRAQPAGGERTGMSRIFGGSEVIPQIGWDGQSSTFLLSTASTTDQMAARAQAVLAQLGFTVGDTSVRKVGSELHAGGISSSGATADVSVAPKPQSKIELRVKVGVVGDRSGSERILNELLKPAPKK